MWRSEGKPRPARQGIVFAPVVRGGWIGRRVTLRVKGLGWGCGRVVVVELQMLDFGGRLLLRCCCCCCSLSAAPLFFDTRSPLASAGLVAAIREAQEKKASRVLTVERV
jgi:hypothetical protein